MTLNSGVIYRCKAYGMTSNLIPISSPSDDLRGRNLHLFFSSEPQRSKRWIMLMGGWEGPPCR